jgi:hypothetical protein
MKARSTTVSLGLFTGLLLVPLPAPAQQIGPQLAEPQLAGAPDLEAGDARALGQLDGLLGAGLAGSRLNQLIDEKSIGHALRRLAEPGFSLHGWFDEHVAPLAVAAETSLWQRAKLQAGVTILSRTDLLQNLWRTEQRAFLRAAAGLDAAARRQLEKVLDDSVYAFSAYMLDPDGLRQVMLEGRDGKQIHSDIQRPLDEWLTRRLSRLEAARDKVEFAADLWQVGGEPLLGRVLKLTDALRTSVRELKPTAVTASR